MRCPTRPWRSCSATWSQATCAASPPCAGRRTRASGAYHPPMSTSGGPMTIPILHSADLAATSAFYVTLGFSQTARWPAYLIVAHPLGIELHVTLDRDVDRWTNGLSCYIRFPDAADA